MKNFKTYWWRKLKAGYDVVSDLKPFSTPVLPAAIEIMAVEDHERILKIKDKVIINLRGRVAAMHNTLEKIEDPRKRDHREPDKYTEVGCMMHMATTAIEADRKLAEREIQ